MPAKDTELGLGAKNEDTPYKKYYILWFMVPMIYLLVSYLGVGAQSSKNLIFFYFMMVLTSLMFFGFDYFSKGKVFNLLDTVTIERTSGMKWMVLIAFAAAIFIGINISVSHVAFVPSPLLQIFEDNSYLIALTSGMVGIIENMFFFNTIFPTLVCIFNSRMKLLPLAIISGIIMSSMIFMGFHFAVYGANSVALVSVFIFGVICSSLVTIFRVGIIGEALHFGNNFSASLVQLGVKFLIG